MTGRARAILIAILLAHVALTTWLSAVLNMWVDEAYTFHTTSLGIAQAAHQALAWEVQPPLFFVLMDIWRHLGFGSSILWARLLSVIAVALGVYVASLAVSRYLSERQRIWVTAAIAFNPFVIAAAVEARVYGLVFLWSALLMWLFHAGYLGDRNPRACVSFAIVAAAALFTQYYSGFLLPGFAAVIVARRQWRSLLVFLGWMVLVGLCFAPVALFVHSEIATNATNFVNNDSFIGNLITVAQRLVLDTVPLEWLGRTARRLALAAIGIILVIALLRSNRAELARVLSVPAIILIVAAVLFAAAVTITHMPVSSHYVAAFHLPVFILLFALFSGLASPLKERATAVVGVVLFVLNIVTLAHDYRTLAKLGDFARVSAFISVQESPHQRIVVFDAQSALPLAYYYKGRNLIVPLPQPMRFDRYDLHDVALHDQSEVVRALEYAPGIHPQVWLVTSNGCRRVPINFRCELLDNFVAQHYDTIIDRQFTGSRVRLLRERL